MCGGNREKCKRKGETRPEERISYFKTRVKRLHLSIVQIYGMPMVRGTIMRMARCCLMFIDCSGYSATGAVYKSNFTLLEQFTQQMWLPFDSWQFFFVGNKYFTLPMKTVLFRTACTTVKYELIKYASGLYQITSYITRRWFRFARQQ